MPKCRSSVGHLKTAEKFTYCSHSAWRKFAGGRRAAQRDADMVWNPSSQLHCVINLKQGDTSPAKFNLYCWEPALKKITPFLSAWYSFSRNSDVTVAVGWPRCCSKNKEMKSVRDPLWFRYHLGKIPMFPQVPMTGWYFEVSLYSFKHFVLQQWRGTPLSTAASNNSNKAACVVSSSQMMFVNSGKCTHFQSQSLESFHTVPALLWGTIKKTIPPSNWSSTARAPSGACRTHQLQNNML